MRVGSVALAMHHLRDDRDRVYGITETAPISFITRRGDDLERRVSTVGRVMPNVEEKIIDPATLNIVGRIKDMVIRGGENLYPREIEEVLFQHPAVGSAQVIGVPDPRTGEELMAWVVVREGTAVDEDDLRAFCGAQLAHFKVPRYWHFVDEFPMTVTGKVQKFKMREIAIELLGLHEAAAIKTA